MKKNILYGFFFALAATVMVSCGQENTTAENNNPAPPEVSAAPPTTETATPADEGKGIGEIKTVELTSPLDKGMIDRGKGVYDMKCAACHKLDETKVVGPGWKGVTDRRKPEWIMNFVTNVDVMLDKDPQAQKLLEECLTRMPNQNLTVADARDILEFMRENDGQK